MLKLIKKNSLPAILLIALFFRLYRINDLLGFWYDQGRDALVIWDLIHNHKFFLIGPTTGLAGVFRGPWYYYLIAPFYWLGKGSPVIPAVFLALTTVLAIYITFRIAQKFFGNLTAYLFLIISSFSFVIVNSSRWLSNPTPMFLISSLFLLGLMKVTEKKNWGWYLVALMAGMAMQFGSAAEVFYVPAVIIFVLLNKKLIPNLKTVILSIVIFIIPFLPQLFFDIRHGLIITHAIISNFSGSGGEEILPWGKFFTERLSLYYNIIASKLFFGTPVLVAPFLLIGIYGLIRSWRKSIKNIGLKVILVLVITPFVGLLFFRGNSGNVYDYYFTGYYFPIIILFSFLLTTVAPRILRNILIGVFVILFLWANISLAVGFLSSRMGNPPIIYLGDQLAATEWIYKDAGSSQFNIDVYVPPVIPYAYQYLFKWKTNPNLVDNQVKLLYTLEEADADHPERISAWMSRQERLGKIEESATFGLITVQRRERFSLNEK
jgi:4-amino-4-deoxy-L-arabinose transferase-like glycosyltransferase